jgi:hypothetical protein
MPPGPKAAGGPADIRCPVAGIASWTESVRKGWAEIIGKAGCGRVRAAQGSSLSPCALGGTHCGESPDSVNPGSLSLLVHPCVLTLAVRPPSSLDPLTQPTDPGLRYDTRYPVGCFDEACQQLFGEVRPPHRTRPGKPALVDSRCEGKGVCHQLLMSEPLRGWRHVEVTERLSKEAAERYPSWSATPRPRRNWPTPP